MIRIKMGGYLNEDDKILTKQELDEWIVEVQAENARLREALEFYASTSSWRGENGEDFKILFEDVSLPNNSSSYVGGRRAREVLKGGE